MPITFIDFIFYLTSLFYFFVVIYDTVHSRRLISHFLILRRPADDRKLNEWLASVRRLQQNENIWLYVYSIFALYMLYRGLSGLIPTFCALSAYRLKNWHFDHRIKQVESLLRDFPLSDN